MDESDRAPDPPPDPASAGGAEASQPSPEPTKVTAGPTVVGIGASSGGLAALKALFQHVPADSGLAFVVVVHLSPEHESHLAELLQPHVKVPVEQVTGTVALLPDRVYVIPPGRNLSAVDTHLRLSELEEARRNRAPIDHFFRTLARTHDGHSVGVILTGTGSDGALGVRAVKEQGGLVIVQDPVEAEYDGMPQSAIATGLVDLVLPLAEIPGAIARFDGTEPHVDVPAEGEEPEGGQLRLLQGVFAVLRARTGRDFSRYKPSTLLRRISRRMQLGQVEEVEGYLARLRSDADEAQALADDFLIGVTRFFRDAEVFEHLAREVIPGFFEGKGAADEVRVWSAGCATGEEAYSLAILLLEEAARHEARGDGPRPRLQVFASDLHQGALRRAREGFYPGDIAGDVSAERLSRFFRREDGGYRIGQLVRELVVFAAHDVLADPPFSRIDLVVCRNVLIYLQRGVQQDVAAVFHYALRAGGVLALGTSESIEPSDLFRAEDEQHGLYRRRDVVVSGQRLPVFSAPPPGFSGAPRPAPREALAAGVLHQRLVERIAPPSLLVGPDDRVVHLSEHAGRYLVHPGGEPTTSVFRIVREELGLALRAAVHGARARGEAVRTEPLPMRLGAEDVFVVVDARPALDPSEEGFVLVLFDERAAPPAPPPTGEDGGGAEYGDRDAERALRAELDRARQRLQAIAEEHRASRKAMRAANEELQSINEELRSTMEELETSKEELQSMNEELQTVGQENRHKVEELRQLSGDLQNLLLATDIATLFLDRELRILRFTPRVAGLFNVRPADRGRPLTDLTHRLGYDALLDDARSVLEHLSPVEREVEDEAGRWYLTRVLPYRSVEDRIEGVVITFVDITARREAEEAVRAAKVYAERIIGTLHEPLLVLTPELRVRSASPAFYGAFQLSPADTEGRLVYELGGGQWDIPALRSLLQGVLAEGRVFTDFEATRDFEGVGERTLLVDGRRLEGVDLILLSIRDVTEERASLEALRRSEERARMALGAADIGSFVWYPDEDRVEADRQMLVLLGLPAGGPISLDDALGRLLHPDDRAPYAEAIAGALESSGEGHLHQAVQISLPDGSERHLVFTAQAEFGGDPRRPLRLSGVALDVTEEVERTAALNRLNETLEERVVERAEQVSLLSARLAVAEQEERQRLARVLHDDLQQQLSGLALTLGMLQDAAPKEAVNLHRSAAALVEDSIALTRSLAVEMSPPALAERNLEPLLRWLGERGRALHRLDVGVEVEGPCGVEDADVRALLYSALREVLFNVSKHAGTARATLRAYQTGDTAVVEVEDEGVGFDAEGGLGGADSEATGLGLASVRERLRLAGGSLRIDSARGRGTRVTLSVPAGRAGGAPPE